MSSRTQTAYDAWSVTYDTDLNPHTTLETPDVLDMLGVTQGSRVLDAACGTGRYVEPLLRTGAVIQGFDFSEGMLNAARARFPQVDFQSADLSQALPYRDGSFTHVLCTQALKHLPDLHAPFRELARVLEPRGRLVFSVTHPEMDWSDYELSYTPGFICSHKADSYQHKEQDYRAAIASAELVVEEWRAVRVSKMIERFLTPPSFQKMLGRAQIAAVRCVRV